ncbi:TetR/AcrR family transcriptional regulator [Microbacterium sp. cf332]|uniref:TetR/AcrR family transcriptional regulator n=1 Tax=Microbacterium sp. cf332 TaxID=1761804 RepID=UPI00088584DE|nr:TetR/AcrR family transcriptional regulator [Microbacterium sp. cf332]SDQ08851.1 transcriptional regulator, TetR family [Microbacterium sp. cf332]
MARWAPDAALRLERAAMDLFLADGYAKTTVPRIAERAGLTTRTFFRHFADKRDVLFLREREFPAVVRRLLEDAPAGLDPMALALHGVTGAAGELEQWREQIRIRRTVIESDARLHERERLKSAALTEAIRSSLVDHGTAAVEAALVSSTAVSLFDTAVDLWIGGDSTRSLVSVLDGLRALLASFATSVDVPGAEPR